MSSNDNNKTSARDETAFQLDISASEGATLESAGFASLGSRGQATGPDSLRMATDKEEEQINAAGQASIKNREQNKTDQAAESSTGRK